MAQTTVLIGYVNANGDEDIACISPSMNAAQGGICATVTAQVAALGITPVWADSPRERLATAVATELHVPQGQPAGWAAPVETEETESESDEAVRTFTGRQLMTLAKVTRQHGKRVGRS